MAPFLFPQIVQSKKTKRGIIEICKMISVSTIVQQRNQYKLVMMNAVMNQQNIFLYVMQRTKRSRRTASSLPPHLHPSGIVRRRPRGGLVGRSRSRAETSHHTSTFFDGDPLSIRMVSMTTNSSSRAATVWKRTSCGLEPKMTSTNGVLHSVLFVSFKSFCVPGSTSW